MREDAMSEQAEIECICGAPFPPGSELGVPCNACGNAPGCANHKPVQHRDGKPPWCNACGWTSPVPAVPAMKVGEPKSRSSVVD